MRESVRNAMRIARERNYRSIAFPLIGAGTGGGKPERVVEGMRDELRSIAYDGSVVLVRYQPASGSGS